MNLFLAHSRKLEFKAMRSVCETRKKVENFLRFSFEPDLDEKRCHFAQSTISHDFVLSFENRINLFKNEKKKNNFDDFSKQKCVISNFKCFR